MKDNAMDMGIIPGLELENNMKPVSYKQEFVQVTNPDYPRPTHYERKSAGFEHRSHRMSRGK
jgi:hypothetical protein